VLVVFSLLHETHMQPSMVVWSYVLIPPTGYKVYLCMGHFRALRVWHSVVNLIGYL
jgi:hypothetical protein